MYKIKDNLSKSCLTDLFSVVNGNYYNLRSQSDFWVPGIKTVFYGANSIRYFGSVIWNSLPNDLTNICDFDLFKTTIRRWKPVDCPCRLCKNYLGCLDFISWIWNIQECNWWKSTINYITTYDFFFLKQIYLSGKGYATIKFCIFCMQLNFVLYFYVIFRCI